MSAVAHVWTGFDDRPRFAPGRARVRVVETAEIGFEPARLIRRIAEQADRAAFAALFEHFAPRVKSYLLRLGAPGAAAEELAQETMLAVWRKAALFDASRAAASTWIFTIARNLRIDAIRRDRPPPDAEDPTDSLCEPCADDGMMAAERESRVREALKTLPVEQVQVVELSFFSDEPHSAIAERLGLPLGTVKSRLRLAMGRLRALLEDIR